MLALNSSAHVVEGVPLVPDFHDPYQYWCLPNRPHLAVDEHNRPAIRFLVFKENLDDLPPDQEHAAAFLVFDTSIGWPKETLDKAARKLQRQLNLDRPPRISPVLCRRSSVRLVFLDRSTTPDTDGQPAPDGDPPPELWVPLLETSGTSSGYGEYRAVFAAMLTKKAAALVLGAFEGFIPAGVIYTIDLVGMQRAFNVHASVDWEQVYTYLRERFQLDVFFVTADVDTIVQELEERQVIKLEASLEGVGPEAMEGEFNAVRKQLQEFILDKFFKPQPSPDEPVDASLPDRVVDFAQDMRNLGSLVSAGYTLKDLSTTEVRSADIDYTVARAVERTIAPQGHLSLFFEDYALTRDQVVTVVDGNDDLWREVELKVVANADFHGDGLAGVGVDIGYGKGADGAPDRIWSFLLDPANTVVTKAAWYDPEVGDRFQYRYRAYFSPDAVEGPEPSVGSGWVQEQGSLLMVSPAKLYQTRRVEVELSRTLPLALFPEVRAELRYHDPLTGWSHQETGMLNADTRRWEHAFRTRHGAPAELEYRLLYAGVDGHMQTDWLTSSDELIVVDDPRTDLFTVLLVLGGDRAKISDLFVNFRYDDRDGVEQARGRVLINQQNLAGPHEWTFSRVDPGWQRYWYSQTMVDTDGNVTTTGWVQDDRATLPVGMVHAKRWTVHPEVFGPPLGDNGLERIKLDLEYVDGPYRVEKALEFSAPGKGESWQLELKDPAVRDYRYRASYVFPNGQERRRSGTSSDTFLLVSSVPPPAGP